MFNKILIANRGEIANRIIKTCKSMGIKTVAVYSEADAKNPYVREADETYLIGPASVRESYLKGNDIIKVALDAKADAIHPGYGFLSEDPHFARACREAELAFIGPNPAAIQAMGKKIQARETMALNDIPVVKGSAGTLESVEQAIRLAEEIGFPVLLKASGGGGGIGMEVANGPEEIKKSFNKCKSRAKACFGDEAIYLEKYLVSPRHIEVQIVADHYGNVWHLGERDCSVQRRHQKVIEESPSQAVTDKIREEMGEVAVRAASSIGYDSVGTVEMLMDEDNNFYFLEMNTRIQVEHGVTELRTGVDLIELQILSAAGERVLPIKNNPVGHSIECRIYAENPVTFFPSCGVIEKLNFPAGDGIRIDHSIEKGYNVTPFYDPLLAKVMVLDSSREKSIKKMCDVLNGTTISGISTNITFLLRVLENEEFIKNGATTLMTENILSELKSQTQLAKTV